MISQMEPNQLDTHSTAKKQLRFNYYYRQIWRFYKKPVTRVSLGLLLTIFIITIFAVFAINPTLNTIGELLRTIEDRERVLDQLRRKAVNLSTAQTEYSIIADRLPLLEQAVPEEIDIQNLTLMIEAIAAENNLILSNIRINQELVYPESEARSIQEFSFTVSLEGNYPEIEPFINDLVMLPRIITIDTIRFTRPQSRTRARDGNHINLTINAKAYYGKVSI